MGRGTQGHGYNGGQAPPSRDPEQDGIGGLLGGFTLNTRPAVEARADDDPWQHWYALPGSAVGTLPEESAMKHGVPVHVGEPMGVMDAPAGARRFLSRRASRAVASLPAWRRWLAAILLWLGAGIARLERRTRGLSTTRLDPAPALPPTGPKAGMRGA